MNIHLTCPMTGSGNVTMSDRVTLQYIDQNKSIHVHGLSCTGIYNSTNSQIFTITIYELGCQHLYIAQSTGTGCQSQKINMHFQSSLADRGQSLLLILLHSKYTQMYL